MKQHIAEISALTERAALTLHEDRFFDPDPQVRRIARELFEETRRLPLICPHGHVDPRLLAENQPFPEPGELLITPDHYIFRMLYSRGLPMEQLGLATRDGSPVERDGRRIWQTFAEHYYLFRGTPTGLWLDYELAVVFGIAERLNAESAQRIYAELVEKLASPEFLPRALFERFNIEVLATTDKATDSLEHHRAIRAGWDRRVIPTFRPDALFRIAAPGWVSELESLRQVTGQPIGTYAQFAEALQERRWYFKRMGATATDHAVVEPYTERLSENEVDGLFQRALREQANSADQRRFEAHMLMEMARMSLEDGLVMQLHPGALRDHNTRIAERFGPDMGADIPVATEYTRNLSALLNAYGNDARLRLIVFTLDESTYSRELAPLAGHYPALRLGPPWWFFDSIEGMVRFRERTTETAGFYNTAGFNDDTRAFCSIPARHDLCRRVDANYLAGLVARHIIHMDDAREIAQALAYGQVKETYRLE
jgi:glucuronate isomerase